MKIEVKKSPRYKDAPDEGCIHYLSVNGFVVGTYYGGEDKKYLDPEKWAKEMVKKRLVVVNRNIKRMSDELAEWRREKMALES